MSSEEPAGYARIGRIGFLIGYLALAVALQASTGAFESGFGGYPDESAHLVTGLMVRDFIHTSDPTNAMEFARDYYLHYPKVGIGQWPPGFYGLQGAWLSLSGATRAGAITLICLLAAITAWVISLSLLERAGWLIAALSGGLYLLTPLVQEFSGMVMTEIPMALWGLLAALSFACFLEQATFGRALGFTFFSVIAIMTKGNGFALAFVPPASIVLAGRYDVAKRPLLWASGAVVGVVCLPWYLVTISGTSSTWGATLSAQFVRDALVTNFGTLLVVGGTVVAVLGIAGVVSGLRSDDRPFWAALFSWIIGVVLLHTVIPAGQPEPRFMIPALPAWFIFVGGGLAAVQRRFQLSSRRGLPVVCALVLASFALQTFYIPRKEWFGWQEAGIIVVSRSSLHDAVILVSSDSTGEGVLIAEIALREERPGHVVLRASKVLSASDWLGTSYEAHYDNQAEVAAVLRRIPVGAVVIDRTIPPWLRRSHHEMLERMVEDPDNNWVLIAELDAVRHGARFPGGLQVWEQVGHESLPGIELEFAHAIGELVIEPY